MAGIDPAAPRMQNECSTIWATSPSFFFSFFLFILFYFILFLFLILIFFFFFNYYYFSLYIYYLFDYYYLYIYIIILNILKFISNKKKSTTAGFEPTLPMENSLAGSRLNHSAKLSFSYYFIIFNSIILFFFISFFFFSFS